MDQSVGRADVTGQSQTDIEVSSELKKKVRHRKKLLINRIRLQMEFYFSAANLSKDQFMAKLLNESPYIELKTFLVFNRIRALTDDISLIQKAVRKSQTLELSKDGLKVKRITEVVRKDDELECTIYVENIPSHVDHEWVHEIFSQYGCIDYISLPHFKSTGRPKGFAFIEFETPQIAEKALQAFGAFGSKMSVDMEPDQLQSVRTYEGNPRMAEGSYVSQKYSGEIQSPELVADQRSADAKNTDDESGEKERNEMKKRKREEEDAVQSKNPKDAGSELENGKNVVRPDSEEMKTKHKRIKTDLDSEETGVVSESGKASKKSKNKALSDKEKVAKKDQKESEAEKGGDLGDDKNAKSGKRRSPDEIENEEVKNPKKHKSSETASPAELEEEEVLATDENSLGKTKKNKKKRKRNKREKIESVEVTSLKVMSKREWLQLRNKYLNIQRQNMKLMKEDLHQRKYNDYAKEREYSNNAGKPGGKTLEFTPNAILKISFEGPPQDPRKLQETIREGGCGGVAYVETSPAEKDVYVRFHSAEAAAEYLKSGCWSRMILLSGEEEKAYWDHCIEAWQKKRNKKGNTHSSENRGKEKLLQRALREAGMRKPNAHIVFN